jgi:hypothetical protein
MHEWEYIKSLLIFNLKEEKKPGEFIILLWWIIKFYSSNMIQTKLITNKYNIR